QAEDGIRDFHVTGVQTCALPISVARDGPISVSSLTRSDLPHAGLSDVQWERLTELATSLTAEQSNWVGGYFTGYAAAVRGGIPRSEERRVGKGCTARRVQGQLRE